MFISEYQVFLRNFFRNGGIFLIYERIKLLCKKKGISVNQLEKALYISRGALCKIDTNKPGGEKLQKLSDFFGVSIEYLMTGEEKEINETHYQNDNTSQPLPIIMNFYNQLNDAGKAEATKYTKNLTFVPDYTETSLIDAIENAPKTQEELEAMLINESIKHNAG